MSDAKDYISKKQIPQLFECLMTGLMYHRPSDHIAYLQNCLEKIKVQGVSGVRWDLFLEAKRTKTPLPPVTPPKSSRGSSRAASRGEQLAEKKPLPPIGSESAKPAEAEEAPSRLQQPVQCPVLLLLGGPGSGKRQVCHALAARYGFEAICVGDLVRENISKEKDSKQLWRVAGAAVESGDAVPEELLLPTLLEALDEKAPRCKGLIIEGYPRTMAQAEALEGQIPTINAVVLLDFEEDLLQERLLLRYQQQRSIEDQPANIAKRLGFFRTHTLPVCRRYDDQEKLLVLAVDEELGDDEVEFRAQELLDGRFEPTAEPRPRPPSGPRPKYNRPFGSRPGSSGAGGGDSVDDAVASTGGGVTFVRELVDLPSPSARPAELPTCPIVLVLGGPGSGRSSQLKRLAERYEGFVHVNVSEEARRRSLAPASGDAWGALLDIATAGDVDDDTVDVELVLELMGGAGSASCLLVEGFPITERQLRQFYQRIGDPDLTVLLDCEEPYMIRRLLQRGKSDGSIGDNLAAVSKRIAFFKEHTLPVVRHFDDKGKLCIILGDRDDSEVQYDLTSLIDYVFFNQVPDHVKQQQDRAADTIQAAFQGFLARQDFTDKVSAEQQQQEQQQEEGGFTGEEEEAAARIQAGFRGYQTRKQMTQK